MARLTPEELEARMHRLLREQPLRSAPASLEQRVMAEIARRRALPWWRQSYAQWPLGARMVFLAVSVAIAVGVAWIAGSALGLGRVGNAFSLALQPVWNAVEAVRSAGATLAGGVKNWIPPIPHVGLYAAIGAAALGYATLLGIGATAYRFFWQRR